MHKLSSILFLMFLSSVIYSQEEKGVASTLSPKETSISPDSTFAIVFGVSSYKHIKELNYAHIDAIEFYKHLIDADGEALNPDNVKLYIEDEVTRNNVLSAFYGFLNDYNSQAKKIIIYFSGHGDSDAYGYHYLLLSNCNPANDAANYGVTDAVAFSEIKNKTQTFIMQGIEVVFVMDACRSKDLLGNKSSKMVNYSKQLEKSDGEIFIFSCENGEVSKESKEWGGGRGLFSYYFSNALNGKADLNLDGYLSINEIRKYVENGMDNDYYNEKTQIPDFKYRDKSSHLIFRSNKKNIENCEEEYKVLNENKESNVLDLLEKIELKGEVIEDDNEVDFSNITLMKFNFCIDNKDLISYDSRSALYHLKRLIKQDTPIQIINECKLRLGVELLDSCTLILNSYLNQPELFQKSKYNGEKPLNRGLEMFNLAEELLSDRYFPIIELNYEFKYFFEVTALLERNNSKEIAANLKTAIAQIDSAIDLNPKAAYFFHLKSLLLISKGEFNEAIKLEKKAVEIAPFWIYPYNALGNLYNEQRKWDKAIESFNKAINIDSSNYIPYIGLSKSYKMKGKIFFAELYLNLSIEKDSINPFAYYNGGNLKMQFGKYDQAKLDFEKCIAVDSLFYDAYIKLAIISEREMDFDRALFYYKEAIDEMPKEVYNTILKALKYSNIEKEYRMDYQKILDKLNDE